MVTKKRFIKSTVVLLKVTDRDSSGVVLYHCLSMAFVNVVVLRSLQLALEIASIR